MMKPWTSWVAMKMERHRFLWNSQDTVVKFMRKLKERISKDDSQMSGSASGYDQFLDGEGCERNKFRRESHRLNFRDIYLRCSETCKWNCEELSYIYKTGAQRHAFCWRWGF